MSRSRTIRSILPLGVKIVNIIKARFLPKLFRIRIMKKFIVLL